jgi:hypothetical protein
MGVVTGLAIGSMVAGVVGKGIEAKQQSNAYKRAEETLEKKRVKSEEAWAAWKEENAPVFAARRAAQDRLIRARGGDPNRFTPGDSQGGVSDDAEVPIETMAGVIPDNVLPATDISGSFTGGLTRTAPPGTGGALLAGRDADLARENMGSFATQDLTMPGYYPQGEFAVPRNALEEQMVMGNPALSGRTRY